MLGVPVLPCALLLLALGAGTVLAVTPNQIRLALSAGPDAHTRMTVVFATRCGLHN